MEIPLAKLIFTVPVNVLLSPMVAAPAVNAPAVFVKPLEKIMLAAVVTAVDVQVPAVLVTRPVNVFTPVLLASEIVPAVLVVPPTVKVPVARFIVAPAFTVKLPASVSENVPSVNTPLVPPPTTIFPTLLAGEISKVTVCPF